MLKAAPPAHGKVDFVVGVLAPRYSLLTCASAAADVPAIASKALRHPEVMSTSASNALRCLLR